MSLPPSQESPSATSKGPVKATAPLMEGRKDPSESRTYSMSKSLKKKRPEEGARKGKSEVSSSDEDSNKESWIYEYAVDEVAHPSKAVKISPEGNKDWPLKKDNPLDPSVSNESPCPPGGPP